MAPGNEAPSLDVVVIGGSQAGLAIGYHLAQRGLRFLILDAGPEIGHAWRSRWDSLRLFTPAQYSSLPGMAFPSPRDTYPAKDDVAAYLQGHARRGAYGDAPAGRALAIKATIEELGTA